MIRIANSESIEQVTIDEFKILRADLRTIQAEYGQPPPQHYHLRGSYSLGYNNETKHFYLTYHGRPIPVTARTEGEHVLYRLLSKTLSTVRRHKTLKAPTVLP
jgi:hypothetical protein